MVIERPLHDQEVFGCDVEGYGALAEKKHMAARRNS